MTTAENLEPITEEQHLIKLGRLGDCAILTKLLTEALAPMDVIVRIQFRDDVYHVAFHTARDLENPTAIVQQFFAGIARLGIRHYEHVRFAAHDRATTHTYWTDEYVYDERFDVWRSIKPKPTLVERLLGLLRLGR